MFYSQGAAGPEDEWETDPDFENQENIEKGKKKEVPVNANEAVRMVKEQTSVAQFQKKQNVSVSQKAQEEIKKSAQTSTPPPQPPREEKHPSLKSWNPQEEIKSSIGAKNIFKQEETAPPPTRKVAPARATPPARMTPPPARNPPPIVRATPARNNPPPIQAIPARAVPSPLRVAPPPTRNNPSPIQAVPARAVPSPLRVAPPPARNNPPPIQTPPGKVHLHH